MNFRSVKEAGYSENILKFEELLEDFGTCVAGKGIRALEDTTLVDGVRSVLGSMCC